MNRQKILLIVFFALLFLLFIVILFQLIGKRNSSGTEQSQSIQNQQYFTREKRRIRKITVERNGKCLVIGEDAVVRTYDTCDGELEHIQRMADPKHVLELLEYVSRLDPNLYKKIPSVPYLTLVIQTDSGSVTIYVPITSGGPDSIPDTIDLIVGDLPQPTQTPGPTYVPTPTIPGSSPYPTNTLQPTIPMIISPTPSGPVIKNTFTCGYSDDQTGIRPFYVSQVICSTEPSPAP